MSDALREQLLKAGLADEKAAKKAAREARHAKQRRQKQPAGDVAATTEAARAEAEKTRRERQQRDRSLNQQRDAQKARRAAASQVDDLLKSHALSMRDGTIAYHFTQGTVIRRVHVTEEQQRRLGEGDLAIVRHRERYHLVPARVAETISQRSPDTFISRAEPTAKPDEDDPYRDFPIPDDLQW
ncbi:MAG: DUF2058 domain-containing protein [Aquisalimonadaceae bacterium]